MYFRTRSDKRSHFGSRIPIRRVYNPKLLPIFVFSRQQGEINICVLKTFFSPIAEKQDTGVIGSWLHVQASRLFSSVITLKSESRLLLQEQHLGQEAFFGRDKKNTEIAMVKERNWLDNQMSNFLRDSYNREERSAIDLLIHFTTR